jgi:non-homologous end joining protein Ku
VTSLHLMRRRRRRDKDTGNRIKYRKVDAETGDEVESDDIIKGYEVGKGQYLEVNPDAKVVNLMEALRQSIAAEGGSRGKPAARSVQHRTGAKKKANKSSARQRKAS